jgi:uncharacterized Zn finger protein
MLIEKQIAERQQRGAAMQLRILKRPAKSPYGDYTVKSASGKTYRVAVRGPGLFENYCSCPDFAVNTLGTCKHIEAMLLTVRRRRRATIESSKYKRTRASVALQYGETIEVRLHLPGSASPALRSLSAEYFDGAGLLRREHYRRFAEVLEALRNTDDRAVVYSDVLEYIDRENELTEDLELERKLLAKVKRGHDPTAGILTTGFSPTRRGEPCSRRAADAWFSPMTWGWGRPCRRWPPPNCCGAARGSRQCW